MAMGIIGSCIVIGTIAGAFIFSLMIWWEYRKEKKRNKLIQIIEYIILSQKIVETELTKMLNIYLREKYEKPKVTDWRDLDTEELEKVVDRYGVKRED